LETELWKCGALVEWADYNSLWRGERSKGDEDELISDFHLRESIVVRTELNHKDPNGTKLHYALANEAADEVRTQEQYRGLRHLAVGTGRTMIRYAESIMNRPPNASTLTISPIAGRLWVGDIWKLQDDNDADSHLESPLDADFSALFIARGLHQAGRERIRFSQISHLAYTSSKEEALQVAKLRCAFDMAGGWNWDMLPPQRVVFGAASIDAAEHRVTKFLEPTVHRSLTPDLADVVQEKFVQCLNLAESLKLPPLADLSVPLFPTVPLPSETNKYSMETASYREIGEKLKELNSMTVAINSIHLRSVVSSGGISQIVAGGKSKHRLIWTLLLPGIVKGQLLPAVNSLCTDFETAVALRQALKSLRKDPALLKQYESILLALQN